MMILNTLSNVIKIKHAWYSQEPEINLILSNILKINFWIQFIGIHTFLVYLEENCVVTRVVSN